MRRQTQKQIALTSRASFATAGFVCSVERAETTENQGIPSLFGPTKPEFTNRGACL